MFSASGWGEPATAVGGFAITADQSHRFALTGQDHTIILWRESDLLDGRVVHRVVILTCPQAVEVAQAILAAAR